MSDSGDQNSTVSVERVIKISDAIIGPLKLPIPPTMTTMNAFIIISNPISGWTKTRGAATSPLNPASARARNRNSSASGWWLFFCDGLRHSDKR